MSIYSSQENLTYSKFQLVETSPLSNNHFYSNLYPNHSENLQTLKFFDENPDATANELFEMSKAGTTLTSTGSYLHNRSYFSLNVTPMYEMLPDFQNVSFNQTPTPDTSLTFHGDSSNLDATLTTSHSQQSSPSSQVPARLRNRNATPKVGQAENGQFQIAPQLLDRDFLASLANIPHESQPPRRRQLVRRTKFNQAQVCVKI
jgi:hypothetical protein